MERKDSDRPQSAFSRKTLLPLRLLQGDFKLAAVPHLEEISEPELHQRRSSSGQSKDDAWYWNFFQLRGERMFKKMYVGNLSFQTPENEVRRIFERFGPVQSVSIISERETGRSKGFGFVEMNEQDALNAIAGLNGAELDGRKIAVNEARPLIRRAAVNGEYRDARARRMRF
jgi:RNA recognition motif-containing protein